MVTTSRAKSKNRTSRKGSKGGDTTKQKKRLHKTKKKADGSSTSWVIYPFSDDPRFNRICTLASVLVAVCAVAEHIQPVPYGKFGDGEGLFSIGLSPRVGWWLMELPCSTFFVYQFFFVGGPQADQPVPRFFAFVFCCHYIYRGWIFPYMIKPSSSGTKNFDAGVALGSWGVTLLHAYLNARWYAEHGTHLSLRSSANNRSERKTRGQKKRNAAGKISSWTQDFRFRLGITMYYIGFVLTIYHDHLMRELRPCPNNARYCIPHGGLYDYVTMGGYTSELLAWLGFAIASWGPNGLFIFLVSLGNLVPRAATSHQWYLDTFPEYADLGRSRLIPGVW